MLKIDKDWEVAGWKHALRGMRNAKNSWDRSDSDYYCDCFNDEDKCPAGPYRIGPNDYELATTLRDAGTDHRKYMRMIVVWMDITAPLYWWKEFDTYKVGTVANSCSTMHKIHEKVFEFDDFSYDHIDSGLAAGTMGMVIRGLNIYRKKYLETKDKQYWWQMIQLLPSSYNQRRTVKLNYEVLANIYHSRRNHKLDEWHTFCDWIESLPYSELITGKKVERVEE